jgi:GNAT superfamily N-acetyltransferase
LEFKLSYAGRGDLELLVSHRLNMWRDIHPEFGARIDGSEALTRRWIKKKLSQHKLIGIIARAKDGRVAGSGCIWLRDEQPRPTNTQQLVPYLMSMYTEEEFRHKGVARLIVTKALKWCRDHKFERVVLHASKAGRPLYEEFGFLLTTEMRLNL